MISATSTMSSWNSGCKRGSDMLHAEAVTEMHDYVRPHATYMVCHDCGVSGGDATCPLCGFCGRPCCRQCWDEIHNPLSSPHRMCGSCPELAEPTLNPHPISAQHDLDKHRMQEIVKCLHGSWKWGNG